MGLRRLLAGLLAGMLLAGIAGSAETPEDAAQVAAEAWLKLVDQGHYQASWQRADELFQDAVPEIHWPALAQRARVPFGKLLSRRLKSRQYLDQLAGAPDGRYVVLHYEARFEHKAAIETVTPVQGDDGTWRVSGYYIR